LVHGIEGFEKSSMKHTETSEKISLPNQEGRILNLCFLLFMGKTRGDCLIMVLTLN